MNPTQEIQAPQALHTPTEMSPDAVSALSEVLNALLADAFALYLKSKNFHWHVSGPHFRDYHELFEEQATEILAITDQMAERVRKIGGATIRSIAHIGELQRLKNNDDSFVTPGDMVRELMDDNKAFVASMREAHELCGRHRDLVTASLIENWMDEAEKRIWFLFEVGRTAH